jgi:mRNA interferase MazF
MARAINNKYENMFRWMSNKLKIQDKFQKNDQRNVKYPRGSIYTCHFGENIGHEKSRLEARPCVVVSNNRINYKSTNIVVIPLTKEIKYKDGSNIELRYEWHYVLKKSKYCNLNYDSAVQCEDIRSVSKARLGKYICTIDRKDLDETRKRVKKALQI